MTSPTISTYLIATMMFVFFIMGGVILLGSMDTTTYTNYNTTRTLFNTSFNKMNEINANTAQLQSIVNETGTSSQIPIIGQAGALMVAAFGFFRNIPTTFIFIFEILTSMSTVFSIPSWIPAILISIIIIGIVTKIISIVFYREV